MLPAQRALISVYDKHGLDDFARDLSAMGIGILSTGGTREYLENAGVPVTGVSEYTGHPELRRLLMPDDWVGYPMRKDYEEAAEYRGMSTSRYSVLELLDAYDKEHPQTEGVRPRIVEIDPDKE